jgi:glyoxylase-like metal-dependent hydrolase (beta-lactamase superfamily II)
MMNIMNLGGITNSYIFPLNGKYVLVDTGYENGYPAFCRRLEQHHISLDDIAYVFLTHAHDDHAGFLNELLHHTDAKVIMHPNALTGLRRGQNSFAGGCSGRLAYAFCNAMAAAGKGEHRFPPIEPELEKRTVTVDDTTRGRQEEELLAKIVDTPGHTSCSISLYLNDGTLFCGDAAMNGFPSLRRATIWIEDPVNFCAAWEKMITLKPKTIYPGHGRPFPASDLERFLPHARNIKLIPLNQS